MPLSLRDSPRTCSDQGAEQREGEPHDVAAVVVTYHPDIKVLENLATLRPQVERLVVVDNGSTVEERDALRITASNLGLELIENGENLGIATALNIGVRLALTLDAQWIFLFDQDSQVTPGFTRNMIRSFSESRWKDRLALLTPQYQDMRLGIHITPDRAPEGLETAITSGSLLRAETFQRHGLFCDELFIDSVDHEYSLRLRQAGLILDETTSAVLLHSPGDLTFHKLPGPKPFLASNYSPVRRYYQERNKIWMAKRYGRRFPLFFVRQFIVSLKDLTKIVLVEKNSWDKFRYFMRGVADGLRGRMGRFEERSVRGR